MSDDFKKLCRQPGALRKEVGRILRPEFLYSDEFAVVLTSALLTPCHLMFEGPGGYGKSEMTKAVFKGLNIPLFVKGLSPETTLSDLLGGLDAPEMLRTGAQLYRPQSSFMVHPFVSLEEILDASGMALAGLKDILAGGFLRNGDQQVELMTRTLIGATNRKLEDFAQGDESLKAFLDRFTLKLRVIWPSHTQQDYRDCFRLKVALPAFSKSLRGESDSSVTSLIDTLSHILAELSEPGREVPPRVAVECFNQVLIARSLYGHEHLWDQDFEMLVRIQNLQFGLAESNTIISAVNSGIGRYGYQLASNQLHDRIERLVRWYKRAQADDIPNCHTEHRRLELFIDSMLDRFPASKRETVVLKRVLAEVGKSGGPKP